MSLTPRTRSVAATRRRTGSVHLSLQLVVLLALFNGGSREEKASPTKTGPSEEEVVLEGAPVLVGVGDIAVCGTPGDEATAAIVDSLLRVDSAGNVQTVVATFGDNAY